MDKDKKNEEPIDEQYLISMMAGGVRKEGMLPETAPIPEEQADKTGVRKKQQPRKNEQEDYEALFFQNKGNARYGKTAYIRAEFHERITRIIQVVGEDKISFYSYLDNVLEHHFREFGEQITKSFNDKYKPIL